jgi:hypothetical protein
MSTTDVLSGSHLPLLIKLVNSTPGPILEMGMGLNSTPVLHWLCTHQKRQLLSLENDEKWFDYDKYYENEYHHIELVKDWDKVDIFSRYWSIVLIDHRPALRRRIDAVRLKDQADYILLHDAEPEIKRFYGYQRILKHFSYNYLFKDLKPNTLVLSNTRSLKHLLTSI